MRQWGWVLAFCCLSSVLFASQTSKIKRDIDRLIRKVDKNVNIGMVIKDLSNNKILYQKNANRYFVPASNLKLYTDAAAFIYLGPDYRFQTQLLTNSSTINDNALKGNVYLKLSGSPAFTHKNLQALLNKLKQLKVKDISGDFVVVGTRFNDKAYGPGWMLDDTSYNYGAPITSVLIDKNAIQMIINPANKVGGEGLITLDDPSSSITLNNQVTTVRNPAKCKIRYSMTNDNKLSVFGCIGLKRLSRKESVAVKNPTLYIHSLLKEQLKKQGLTLYGKVRMGTLPKSIKVLARHFSEPMSQIAKETLKPSDNLYADSLFLKLAEKYFRTTATWKKGSLAVKRILKQYAGINLSRAVLVDGSGLSRYNLVTPNQTVTLLSFLYKQFPISYEFISALPVAGRDGTLQRRMLGNEKLDLVRAKTGSMLGVLSLAGFLPSRNGHPLAFSMMVNGIPGNYRASLSPYRGLEEQVSNYLLHLDVKAPLITIRRKNNRRVLLPYEKRLSYVSMARERKRKIARLEYTLRRALQLYDVNVFGFSDHIDIKFKAKNNHASFKDNAILSVVRKVVAKSQAWALVKSANQQWLLQARKRFRSHELLTQTLALKSKEYQISVYR